MKDTDVFDGKKFSDLLRDIHDATLSKRSRIEGFIRELHSHITDASDVVVLGPIIKEYLDLMIRNDEHLVKIATLVQRMITAESKEGSGGIEDLLSEDEKKRLMEDAIKELEEEMNIEEIKAPEPKLLTGSVKTHGNTR